MLHSSLHLPVNGIVKDVVDGVENYIRRQACKSKVFLIFDRYDEGSIKADTRSARVGDFRRYHQLSLSRKLPPKDMCLPFSKTKENLIDIVSNDLLVRLSQDPPNMKIVITSKHNVPDEVSN